MSFLQSIFFGILFGLGFRELNLLKEHKKRLNRIEDFLFGEVIAENEVDD